MQKRIDYLNQKLEPIVDRMRGYPAFDKIGYEQLKAQRVHLQNEISWLSEIQRSLHLPIEDDSYNEHSFQVEIRLTIAPQTLISPLNKTVYSPDDIRALSMRILYVDRISHQFAYTDDAVREMPPLRIADQIAHSYIRAAKPLDDMMEGIRFANIALGYFDRMQNQGFGFTPADFKLQHAAGLSNYILNYEGEEFKIVDDAVESDAYLRYIKDAAKEYWVTARKLIAFTLLEGQFNINWKPFGMGLATSR